MLNQLFSLILVAFCTSTCFARVYPEMRLNVTVPKEGTPMTLIVDFENLSKVPINIWQSCNSWGWDNLAIVIVREGVPNYYRQLLNPMFIGRIHCRLKKTEGFGAAYIMLQTSPSAQSHLCVRACVLMADLSSSRFSKLLS